MRRCISKLAFGLAPVGCVLGCVLGCSSSVHAPVAPRAASASAAASPASVLPVQKIRFYESGIAQFDRAGQLPAGTATLPLPTAHLDDVLKTLVVYKDGVAVPAFSANFDAVMMEKNARAQAKLPIDLQHAIGYPELLEGLTGEPVELWMANRRLQGRLVHVAKIDPKPVENKTGAPAPEADAEKAKPALPEFELTILTDGAGVERCSSNDVTRIKPLDPKVAARLQDAVKSTSEHADQASRILSILGTEGKNARISYVSEMPVWRTTYRLRLGGKDPKASLKGLALVHNDTEEPWKSVDIELSNGEPDSFRTPLAAPRYWERQLGTTPENGAGVVAPLTIQSADEIADGVPQTSPQPQIRPKKSIANRPTPSRPGISPPGALPTQRSNAAVTGTSVFAYRVARPASLPARSSSLLPFLDASVLAERGVWFFGQTSVGRSVVRLENTTANAIPAGTMSIFDRDRFVGEVQTWQLEPNRHGYFDFGTELGMEMKYLPETASSSKYAAIVWKDESLTIRTVEHQERPIELTNNGDDDRVAFVVLNTHAKPRVQGADRVDLLEDKNVAIATIGVAAHQKSARTLVIDQENTETPDVDSLEISQLDEWIKAESLTAPARAALREARTAVLAKAAFSTRKDQAEQDVTKIEEAIERLGVGNNTEQPTAAPIAARYVQLEAQRTQLQKLVGQLEKDMGKKSEAVTTALNKLPKE